MALIDVNVEIDGVFDWAMKLSAQDLDLAEGLESVDCTASKATIFAQSGQPVSRGLAAEAQSIHGLCLVQMRVDPAAGFRALESAAESLDQDISLDSPGALAAQDRLRRARAQYSLTAREP